jgi:hypothetical protein
MTAVSASFRAQVGEFYAVRLRDLQKSLRKVPAHWLRLLKAVVVFVLCFVALLPGLSKAEVD